MNRLFRAGTNRTDQFANTAAFAQIRVNYAVFHRTKAAVLFAQSAMGTQTLVNDSTFAKAGFLRKHGLSFGKDQMQVWHIDVTVGKTGLVLSFEQGNKGGSSDERNTDSGAD